MAKETKILIAIMVCADSFRTQAQAASDGVDLDFPTGETAFGDVAGLSDLALKDVPGLKFAKVSEVPGLRDLKAGSLPQLYYLENFKDQNLGQIESIKNLPIVNVPGLATMAVKNVPGLRDVPMKDIPYLKDLKFEEVPGLRDTPILKDMPSLQKVAVVDLNDAIVFSGISFGGEITVKKLKWCIVNIWPPVVFPFQYVEVEQENPLSSDLPVITTKLYRVFLLSKLRARDRFEKSSIALGTYIPEADDAFRQICRKNKDKLKKSSEAHGVIYGIGTSCKDGESPGGRRCSLTPNEKRAP